MKIYISEYVDSLSTDLTFKLMHWYYKLIQWNISLRLVY